MKWSDFVENTRLDKTLFVVFVISCTLLIVIKILLALHLIGVL